MGNMDRKKLREQHPDSWIAVEAGDTLTGTLIDVTDAWSDARAGGSYYPLLTVRTADDVDLKVHCFGAVLFSEIMRHRPEIGERIEISYQGTGRERDKAKSPPELYRVRMPQRVNVAASAYDRIAGTPGGQGVRAVTPAVAAPASDVNIDRGDLPF